MKIIKKLLILTLVVAGSALAQVNINTATSKELVALMGIGPVKAASIIKYRKEHGAFKSVSELVNVDGVGEVTVKKLGSDITVTGTTNLDTLKNKKKSSSTNKGTTTKKSTTAKKDTTAKKNTGTSAKKKSTEAAVKNKPASQDSKKKTTGTKSSEKTKSKSDSAKKSTKSPVKS